MSGYQWAHSDAQAASEESLDEESEEDTDEFGEDAGEPISQEAFDELGGDIEEMTVNELRDFADLYDINLHGKRLKDEIKEVIFDTLTSRIQD